MKTAIVTLSLALSSLCIGNKPITLNNVEFSQTTFYFEASFELYNFERDSKKIERIFSDTRKFKAIEIDNTTKMIKVYYQSKLGPDLVKSVLLEKGIKPVNYNEQQYSKDAIKNVFKN